MSLLPEPYEFLDLSSGQSITILIDRFDSGSAVIHPNNPTPRHVRTHMEQRNLTAPPAPGTPISVEVQVLRLWGSRQDERSSQRYWDVSAKTLYHDLYARWHAGLKLPALIRLTANRERPFKRYSVELLSN